MLSATLQTHAAEAAQWHETEGGKVRLLLESTQAAADGALPPTVRGVVQIELEDGWHTYWREPGAAGIPPTFQFVPWSDANSVDQHFPAPQWLETDGARYAGYSKPVLLPFEVATEGQAQLTFEGTLLLGICEAICIPVVVPFKHEIQPSTRSSTTDQLVRAAFDALPMDDQADMFHIEKVGDVLSVSVDTSELEADDWDMFVSVDQHRTVQTGKQATGGEMEHTFSLHAAPDAAADANVLVVLSNGEQAYRFRGKPSQ
ncbi:MAG: protein-disulfide reductase DsbD domain-containing protein [Pseudomonadota bacterium]